MKGFGNDSNWSREKMTVEVLGDWVETNIEFGHSLVGDCDADLAMTITFISEEFGHGGGVSRVGGETVTGLGWVEDELSVLESSTGERQSGGIGEWNYLHECILPE